MPAFKKIYRENQVEVGTVSLGMGTASSSILDYMGLEDDEKSICFHFVTAATWKKVKKSLQNQLRIDVPGTGIVFVIPMSSIGGKRELGFLVQGQEFVREEESTLKETRHELIVAIANYGYNTQVMKAAEEGGATGGTVLHGKGVGMKRAEQFLGVSLVSEKELILIVARSEQKNAIMQAIMEKARNHIQGRNHCIFPSRNGHGGASDSGGYGRKSVIVTYILQKAFFQIRSAAKATVLKTKSPHKLHISVV